MLCPACSGALELPAGEPRGTFRCPKCGAVFPDPRSSTQITAGSPEPARAEIAWTGAHETPREAPDFDPPSLLQSLCRARFVVLGIYLILLLALVGYYLWYPMPRHGQWAEGRAAGDFFTYTILFLAAQAAFLVGVASFRRSWRGRSLPLWVPLAVGVALIAGASSLGVWAFNPAPFTPGLLRDLLLIGGAVSLVFATQAFFLSGAPALRGPSLDHRRPAWASLVAAALMGSLLCVGLLLTFSSVVSSREGSGPGGVGWPIWFAILGLGWWFWLAVFAWMWSKGWSVAYHHVYAFLFGGTWLEILVTIPADAQVRKRTECYCGESTFFGLSIGLFMALWLFGPGLALLYWVRLGQRRRRPGFCRGCGLDLRQWTGSRCPACGAPFYRQPARGEREG